MIRFSDYVLSDRSKSSGKSPEKEPGAFSREEDQVVASSLQIPKRSPFVFSGDAALPVASKDGAAVSMAGGAGSSREAVSCRDKEQEPAEAFPFLVPVLPAADENPADNLLPVEVGAPNREESTALYDDEPKGAYEVARLLGIDIPASRSRLLFSSCKCLATVFQKLRDGGSGCEMIWPMVVSIIADLEEILAVDSNVATMIQRGRIEGDGHLWHSLYTAVLAMQLAANSSIDFGGATVQEIGAAALLHDVGRLFLSDEDREAVPGNIDSYRSHVVLGVNAVRNIGAPKNVVAMIEQHHECVDGKGFPKGLQDHDILPGSQIVGLANVFERAILGVTHKDESSDQKTMGLSQVFARYRTSYHTALIKSMMALIGYYPDGSLVELTNRSICEVIAQNHNAPLRPVVKMIVDSAGNHLERTRVIDLQEMGTLSIVRVITSIGGK